MVLKAEQLLEPGDHCTLQDGRVLAIEEILSWRALSKGTQRSIRRT
jgi:hypothetical protein